ncbi:hypothetical protein ACFSAG_04445 [Sphingorhabdus buctiana]|uniref:Uncharacterized protein n=1 Tax=Sphingorhabdus buctiana TaxID=1508805 RepID=A0ABW4MCH1_9SPHN
MPSSTMEVITECQERFGVADWQIDSVRVWPFLRLQIGHALEQQNLSIGKKSFRSASVKIKRITRAITQVGRFAKNAENGAAAIFNDGSGYYSNAAGVAANKHYDNIKHALEQLDIKPVHIYDYANPEINNLPGVQQLEAALDGKFIRARVRDLMTVRRVPMHMELEGFKEFRTYCEKLAIDLSILNPARLCSFVRSWVAMRDYMILALPRLNPNSLCFITTYYGYYGMAYTSAMKSLGNVVVDIQHGLQGASHYAYANWQRDANILFDQLPNGYLVWTPNDARNIRLWAKGDCVQIIAPHIPKIDRDPIGNVDGKRISCDRLVVFYSCSLLDVEKQAGLLRQLAQQNLDGMHFLIRSHPTELNEIKKLKKYLQDIGFTNFEVEISSKYPLANVIASSDVHVSICSSVAIECNEMNLPSILIRKYAYDALNGYDIGLFTYVDDGQDAAETLKRIETTPASAGKLRSNDQSYTNVAQAIASLAVSMRALRTS